MKLTSALMAACLVASGVEAATPSALDRVVSTGVLRVGTPGDYRPYTDHIDSIDVRRGSDIELVRAFAANLGVTLQFVSTTWPSLMSDFGAGRFDIAVGGISITAEREKVASFSIPYARDGKTALVACAKLDSLDELRELNDPRARVIVNPGGTNERFARERLPRATLTVHRDNASVFDELAAGRADVMITDAIEARLQAAQYPGVLCAAHPDAPFDRADKAFLLPRDASFKRKVDDWLRGAIQRGEPAAAQARWLAFPWRDAPSILSLVDARLAVMSDVARFKWNTGGSIEDPARERDLLVTLVAQGQALGVPAARTEAFFNAQFAAARRLQHDLFDRWRAEGREKLPPAPDLAKDIRPRLDRISAAMVAALADPALARQARLAARGIASTTLLSAEAARIALAPLERLE